MICTKVDYDNKGYISYRGAFHAEPDNDTIFPLSMFDGLGNMKTSDLKGLYRVENRGKKDAAIVYDPEPYTQEEVNKIKKEEIEKEIKKQYPFSVEREILLKAMYDNRDKDFVKYKEDYENIKITKSNEIDNKYKDVIIKKEEIIIKEKKVTNKEITLF